MARENIRVHSPIGRDNGLKIRPVWVRLPLHLPNALIAQWLEHPTHNRQVAGSNPAGRTNLK